MASLKDPGLKKEIDWTPTLVKMLRGARTHSDFSKLIGVSRNTVQQWEKDRVKPDASHSKKLSKLAEKENFLDDWQLVGSITIVSDIEEGSKKIAEELKKSLARTTQQLAE